MFKDILNSIQLSVFKSEFRSLFPAASENAQSKLAENGSGAQYDITKGFQNIWAHAWLSILIFFKVLNFSFVNLKIRFFSDFNLK